MAKSMFSAAAALLAFSGAASASVYPRSNGTNSAVAVGTGASYSSVVASATSALNLTISSTSSSTSTSASSTSTAAIKYCPNLDGEFVVGPLDVKYQISCDTTHAGVLIDITLQKRATPSSLTDCLKLCSGLTECIAAAYDTENPTCYLFSSVGDPVAKAGFQFAEKASALTSSTSSSLTAAATSTGNGTTSSNSTSPVENLFCPQLDGQVYSDGNDVSYIIQCGDNYIGTVISVAVAKRAATTSILSCMAQCDANAACVGTGYNKAAQTCTLFSTLSTYYYDANVDFAMRVGAAAAAGSAATTTVGVAGAAGANVVTATVYTTTLSTILSCAPTVTNCPLNSVVTDLVVDYTTICPASDLPAGAITATSVPTAAAVIACTDCPYAAVTATVYSTTVSTIYSCAATVTNCPLTQSGVATAAAVASSSGSAAASASAAAAGSNSAAVASAASSAGASAAASVASASGLTAVSTVTSMISVATSLVNYPLPASTIITSAAGAAAASGASGVTGPTATSGLVAFTGAASALQAGMGMAGAVFAGAAFLL